MHKAVITDWVEKFGGAEKVVQAICEIYTFDFYFTYIDRMPDNVKKRLFGKEVIITQSPVLRLFGKFFRYTMPFFPFIVSDFNKRAAKKNVDLIISSSWVLSKGFKVNGAKHICYLQARNFKYVWDEADLYFTGIRKFLSFTKSYLQRFDVESAQNPDLLIANSKFVQDWVKTHYNRDCQLIYPPVEVEYFNTSDQKEDYYITVGRIEPYKRFDIIIDAFNQNRKKLIVIGSGSELDKLKEKAQSNIQFCGFLPKEDFKDTLSKAKGFIYAGVEDFGIAIVEALASGVPVIGYDGGAMREIVADGIDGILFDKQNSESLNKGLERFESTYLNYDAQSIKKRANRFSKSRFKTEFKDLVDSFIVANYPNNE